MRFETAAERGANWPIWVISPFGKDADHFAHLRNGRREASAEEWTFTRALVGGEGDMNLKNFGERLDEGMGL